jgi:hypothetical protein
LSYKAALTDFGILMFGRRASPIGFSFFDVRREQLTKTVSMLATGCVGIVLDEEKDWLYWTQKGGDNAGEGRIFRARIDLPDGTMALTRQDIELVYDNLPEPIDLEIDQKERLLSLGRTEGIRRKATPYTARGSIPLSMTNRKSSLEGFGKRSGWHLTRKIDASLRQT